MTAETFEWEPGYEDSYGGQGFATGAELIADLEARSAPGAFDWELNVPVWVCPEDGRLEVGIMLTRKGRTSIKWTDHYTDDDVQAIRSLLMRVWAMRADAGFARYFPRRVLVTEEA